MLKKDLSNGQVFFEVFNPRQLRFQTFSKDIFHKK